MIAIRSQYRLVHEWVSNIVRLRAASSFRCVKALPSLRIESERGLVQESTWAGAAFRVRSRGVASSARKVLTCELAGRKLYEVSISSMRCRRTRQEREMKAWNRVLRP